MKPYKEIVDILTHLQVVDEIHVFLVKMFEEIVSIKKQGELWVEDKQNLTFMEMKISLTKKISGVLYKCSDFSTNKLNKLTDKLTTREHIETDDELRRSLSLNFVSLETEHQQLLEKFNDMNEKVMLQNSILNRLFKKFKSQQMVINHLEESTVTDKKLAKVKNEIMQELQAASSFMSVLATTVDNFSKEHIDLMKKEEEKDEMIRDIYEDIENMHRKHTVVVKVAKMLKILKMNIVKIKKNRTQDCRESRQALPEGCKVNASNHQKLIPVKEFLLSHLPSRYQHVEMLNLIQSLVDITVKLEVSGMSEERKNFKTNKQSLEKVLNQTQVKGVSKNVDDESNSSNTMSVFTANDVAFGSGKVDDVFIRTDKDGPCPCPKKCPEWGEIRVFTSARLMYDDDDAKHFLCTFFYDDDEQVDQLKYARGERIVLRNMAKDLCMFICVTCDVELIRKLEGMLDKFEQSWEDAFDRYAKSVKWKDERLTVIVSHPYGLKKHIALGKASEDGGSEGGIHYDTPTCEGFLALKIFKMRPYLELADIVLKLQNLDQIKEFLGNILNEVCLVKKKGELWIEEKETLTFEEVKEYIKKTTTDILQRCIAGTSNQFKNISDSSTALESTLHLQSEAPESSNLILTESQSLTEKFEEIHSSFSLQSKKIKKLQQKANDQHKINKILEEKIKKCDDNNAKVFKLQEYWDEKNCELKEEFTEEFQAASSFMSHLQTQCESLSHEFKEYKAMDMIEVPQFTTDDIIEKILRRQQDMYEKLDHLETEQYHLKKNYADKKKARKNLEFMCRLLSPLNVKCVDDCPHLIGHHEQQIFESDEGDCQGYLKNCTKNPGHIDFIRVSNLRLDILPQYYRDPVLYGFIKAVSDLTVKISVTTTSPHRPKFWPGTNVLYPLYKAREKQLFRIGSGKINAVNRRVEATCPCDKCKNSDKPKTDWWEIEVTTAASVVFDESEARFATVRLFYDTEESEDVSVKCAQHSGLFKSIERDLCWFNCVTCDTRLAGKLEKMRQSYEDFLEIVAQKYTLTREIHKLMFLVSHPHGCCKRISFGQWNEKYIVKTYFDKFTYSTCTCPGSSGARVYCLGYAWSIHEGNMKCGLNYSSG